MGTETIAIIGAVAAVAGAAATTVSAVSQAQASSNAAKAEAAAREAEAASAREAAEYEETQFRRRAALLMGKNRAVAGATGLDISSGSPLLSELDTIEQTELEALNIRRTGEVSAQGREFEARLARQRGRYARSTIGPTVVGGVAQAGSSVLGSWTNYQKYRSSSVAI